jgi:hypothetical protein
VRTCIVCTSLLLSRRSSLTRALTYSPMDSSVACKPNRASGANRRNTNRKAVCDSARTRSDMAHDKHVWW